VNLPPLRNFTDVADDDGVYVDNETYFYRNISHQDFTDEAHYYNPYEHIRSQSNYTYGTYRHAASHLFSNNLTERIMAELDPETQGSKQTEEQRRRNEELDDIKSEFKKNRNAYAFKHMLMEVKELITKKGPKERHSNHSESIDFNLSNRYRSHQKHTKSRPSPKKTFYGKILEDKHELQIRLSQLKTPKFPTKRRTKDILEYDESYENIEGSSRDHNRQSNAEGEDNQTGLCLCSLLDRCSAQCGKTKHSDI